ncbi:hypothetical protein M2G70_07455 [Vibrio vulnificus]|nr:hypothetical protein [Vibrio vulnificus]
MSHINISLSANTAAYVKRLKGAKTETDRNIIQMEKRIDEFAKSVNTNFTSVNGAIDTMLKGLGAVKGGGYVAALGALGIASASIATNLTQMASASLASEQELSKAATRARMGAEDFRVLAMATSTVGISLEKMGDISKDVQDKVGDFATAGAGALQDFFDIVGEGNVSFKELSDLNSVEVLQKMVLEMERAGASGAQMTFALESIASDASDLLPLLVNNSAGLKELQERMSSIAKTPLFDKDTIIEMQVMEQNWNTLWDNFGNVAAHKLTGLFEMTNQLLNKMNEYLVASELSRRSEDVVKKVGNNVAGNGEAYKVNTSLSVQHQVEERAVIDKAIADLEKDNILKGLDSKTHKARVTHNNKIIAQLKEQRSILDDSIKKGQEFEKSQKGTNSSEASQVRDLNNKKAEVEVTEGLEKIKAQEALRVAEINQMKIDEDLKTKLIEKAAKDREEAVRKLEEKARQEKEKSAKEAADKEVSIAQEAARKALEIAQGKLDTAITLEDQIQARHELELLQAEQNYANQEHLKQYHDDAVLQSEYNKAMQLAEIKNQNIMDDNAREIANLTASKEFWDKALEEKRISEAEHKELMLANESAYTEAKWSLTMSQLGAIDAALSGISGLAEKGSSEYKALFAVEKAATIAKLGLQMWDAWGAVDEDPSLVTQLSKNLAKGAVIAQYGSAIASAGAAAIGQFHSGSDEVDATGSYILKQGERVIQPTANKDLTAFLDSNKKGSNSSTIKSDLVIQGDTTISEEKFQSMLIKHRENLVQAMRLAQRENPSLR